MLPQNFHFDERYTHIQRLQYLGLSAAISEILSAPFERAKIKLQTVKITDPSQGLSSFLKEITSKEGLKGLYYGFGGALERAIMSNVFKFYSYYLVLDSGFGNKSHQFVERDVVVGSLIATTLATFIGQPSDTIRLKMQGEPIGSEKEKQIGGLAKMRQIMQYNSHPNAVLAGFRINLALQNVQGLMEVFGFFYVRDFLTKYNRVENKYIANGLSAAIVTGLATFITAPLDLLYTRVAFRDLNSRETVLWPYIKHTLMTEGVGGFYRAFAPFFYKNVVFNLSMVTMLQYLLDRPITVENKFEGEAKNTDFGVTSTISQEHTTAPVIEQSREKSA